MKVRIAMVLALATVLSAVIGLGILPVRAHSSDGSTETLKRISPAPAFSLIAQDGKPFSLADARGKVVVLSFIFTSCPDICPVVVYKLVGLQEELGDQFGRDVFFVTVTVDPENDTPELLKDYAGTLGCDFTGWAFLTGAPADIQQVSRDYGVIYRKQPDGEIVHNLLTSVIDRNGILRVQYMGERFNPNELLNDVRMLIAEQAEQ